MQIIALTQKQVLFKKTNTVKEFWVVTINKDGNPFIFDSPISEWNKDWCVGGVIPPVDADQWSKREWNGKTYWTLYPPSREKLLKHIAMLQEEIEGLKRQIDEQRTVDQQPTFDTPPNFLK